MEHDLRRLVDLCRSLSLSRGSKGAYASSLRTYADFCDTFGFDELSLSETELAIAVAQYTLRHTVNAVPPYLSAIQHLWNEAGVGPLPRGPAFKLFHRGLKRLFGTADEVVRTTAITVGDLAALCSRLDRTDPTAVCFGATIIIAFFLALRTEDHVDGRLRWGDIFPQADGSVEFFIPPGKSVRVFRHVAIAARTDGLALGPWLKALYDFLPPWARAPHRHVFPDFTVGAGGGQRFAAVSRSQFTARFKAAVRSTLGLDPALHSGYSLRRGGVTAMLVAGVPVAIIKRHVGWTPGSEAINLYYDHSGYANQRIPTQAI